MAVSGLRSAIVESTPPAFAADVPRGVPERLWHSLAAQLKQLATAGVGVDGGRVRVLDCGGGSGSSAVPLAVLGAQVTVVDVSLDALGTLVRRAAEAGVSEHIVAVQGDAESVTGLVPAAHFGLVLAHDVLRSVSAPAAALGGFADVTVAGGAVSVVLANPVSAVLARALAGDVEGALDLVRRDDSAYGADALVRDCRAAGLTVESVTGLGVFTELISGADSEGLGFAAALTELEAAISSRPPYRDIASKIHVVARHVPSP
jgi:S-adenosylmethionine-dependent methyltransferase